MRPFKGLAEPRSTEEQSWSTVQSAVAGAFGTSAAWSVLLVVSSTGMGNEARIYAGPGGSGDRSDTAVARC